MGAHTVESTVTTRAAPEVVWAILADARSWHTWGPWDSAALEREGDPAPDGVGAIRVFKKRPITSREEVTLFEPSSRLGYRLLSGLSVRGYEAQVTLTPSDGGTKIHWRSQFNSRAPGMGAFMRRVIKDVSTRLAREADRRAAG